MRSTLRTLAGSFVALAALVPREAAADDLLTKEACVAASESAITFRSGGRLREARAELVRCGKDECPAILKEDCASSLRAIDDRIPTVVFGVRDEAGRDVIDGRIFIDEESGEGTAMDGRARAFDPGRHEVRVARCTPGCGPIVATEIIVLREGEKNRVVSITVPRDRVETKPAEVPKPTIHPPSRTNGVPILPIVLAGVGLVGLGLAGGLSLHLDGRIDDLRAKCAPGCPEADRALLSTELVIANSSLIGGVVALAAAGVTWLVMRPERTRATAGTPVGWAAF